MPANDDVESSRSRIQVKLLNVMQDIHQSRASFGHCRGWHLGCPRALVDVPPNGNHWRHITELVDYLRFANVASVDDQIATFQGC